MRVYNVQQGRAQEKTPIPTPDRWGKARIFMPKTSVRAHLHSVRLFQLLINFIENEQAALYTRLLPIEAEKKSTGTFSRISVSQSNSAILKTKTSFSDVAFEKPSPKATFIRDRFIKNQQAPVSLKRVEIETLHESIDKDGAIVWLSWEEIRPGTKVLAFSVAHSQDLQLDAFLGQVIPPGLYFAKEQTTRTSPGSYISILAAPDKHFDIAVYGKDQEGLAKVFLTCPFLTKDKINTKRIIGLKTFLEREPYLAIAKNLMLQTYYLVFSEKGARQLTGNSFSGASKRTLI